MTNKDSKTVDRYTVTLDCLDSLSSEGICRQRPSCKLIKDHVTSQPSYKLIKGHGITRATPPAPWDRLSTVHFVIRDAEMKSINTNEEEEGRCSNLDKKRHGHTFENKGQRYSENSKNNSNENSSSEVFYDCLEPDWTCDRSHRCENSCSKSKHDSADMFATMADNYRDYSQGESNIVHHKEERNEGLRSDNINKESVMETEGHLKLSVESENCSQSIEPRRENRPRSILNENNNRSILPANTACKSNANKSSNNRIRSARQRGLLLKVDITDDSVKSSDIDENENRYSTDQETRQILWRQRSVSNLLKERLGLRRRVDAMLTQSLLHLCVLGVLFMLAMSCRCVFEMLFPCFGESCSRPQEVKQKTSSYWM